MGTSAERRSARLVAVGDGVLTMAAHRAVTTLSKRLGMRRVAAQRGHVQEEGTLSARELHPLQLELATPGFSQLMVRRRV